MEDAKDSLQRAQPRVFALVLLKVFVFFLALGVGFSVFSMYMTRHLGVQDVVLQPRSSFQPCVVEQSSIDRWIRSPSSLMHNMSDEELLWLASFVPRVKSYPFKRVPKIAFVFLTKGPLPLSTLWEKYFHGHKGFYSIYIHSLPSYQGNFTSDSVFYRRQIPSKSTATDHRQMITAQFTGGGAPY